MASRLAGIGAAKSRSDWLTPWPPPPPAHAVRFGEPRASDIPRGMRMLASIPAPAGDDSKPRLGFRLASELAVTIDHFHGLIDRMHRNPSVVAARCMRCQSSSGGKGLGPVVAVSNRDEADKRRARRGASPAWPSAIACGFARPGASATFSQRPKAMPATRGIERKPTPLAREISGAVAEPHVAVLDHLLVGDDFLGRNDGGVIEFCRGEPSS